MHDRGVDGGWLDDAAAAAAATATAAAALSHISRGREQEAAAATVTVCSNGKRVIWKLITMFGIKGMSWFGSRC